MKQHPSAILILTAAAFSAARLSAGTPAAPAPETKAPAADPYAEPAWAKAIWDHSILYKDDTNHFLEELDFVGRYQGQFYAVDGDNGVDEDGWDHRRFRLGVKAKMFDKKIEFYGEMFSELNPGGDFYAGLKNFNLTWKPNDAFNLTVGKLEPKFSYDYSMSDTVMLNFERNALVNQFKNDYGTGAAISGKQGKWSYYASATANQADDKEFGSLDGGWAYVGNISYDLKEALGLNKAVWRFDYVHSEHDNHDTLMTFFDDGVATSLDIKQGRFGLTTEVLAGFGDVADCWGVHIMPTFDITKKLQLVTRYQYAHSDTANGLAVQSRYEKNVGAPRGDTYNAMYVGLNYYIYGQKLKLMSGIEYSDMENPGGTSFDSWTFLSGIRIFF